MSVQGKIIASLSGNTDSLYIFEGELKKDDFR